jgi:phosphatidylserine/phosphatidylglycerophosphate/cardiolipin synthase-like enzyme
LRSLRDAVRRGVRVGVLLDAVNTAGQDPMLLGLAAEPNVEVRLFNPLPAGRERLLTRFARSLRQFERLSHRMQDKLFIADGAMAITGAATWRTNTSLGVRSGTSSTSMCSWSAPLSPSWRTSSIRYWNSSLAYPVASVARAGTATLQGQGHDCGTVTVAAASHTEANDRGNSFCPGVLASCHIERTAMKTHNANPLSGLTAIALALSLAGGTASAQQSNMPATSGGSPSGQGSEKLSQTMMKGMKHMQGMKMTGDTDKDFAMMMKMHHQQAIDMAQVELDSGKSPELKAMARKMIGEQKKEIAELDRLSKELQ